MSVLSSAIDATTIQQAENYYIRALLVGESKDGKTTSAATLPGKKLAVALTPRTRAALAGHSNVDIIEIFEKESKVSKDGMNPGYHVKPVAWDQMWELAVELWSIYRSGQPLPYDSIIWDDLSATSKYCMNHVLSLKKKDGTEVEKGLSGAPAQPHYTPYMSLITQLFFSMLLPLPCHFVLCAHMDLYTDEASGSIFYTPRMYTKLRGEFPSWFDEVYECSSTTDKSGNTVFQWNTNGTGQKRFLGSTINSNSKLWKSPFTVDLSQPISGFSKMLALRKEAFAHSKTT